MICLCHIGSVYSLKNPEKSFTVYKKKLIKGHVTLKTGVMATENSTIEHYRTLK